MLECNESIKISDGFCNDETNNVECDYDGGVCCGSCVLTQLCSDCACLGNSTTNIKNQNVLLGDGYCNDETNNALCSFDGLDCCRCPDSEYICSKCHGKLLEIM